MQLIKINAVELPSNWHLKRNLSRWNSKRSMSSPVVHCDHCPLPRPQPSYCLAPVKFVLTPEWQPYGLLLQLVYNLVKLCLGVCLWSNKTTLSITTKWLQNTIRPSDVILRPQRLFRHRHPRHSVAIDDPKAAAEDDGTATSNLEICGSTLRCPRFHQSPLELPLGTNNKRILFVFFELLKFEMPSNNSRKLTENMCMCLQQQ